MSVLDKKAKFPGGTLAYPQQLGSSVTDKGWPLHPSASAVITVCQNNSHLGREAHGGTSAPQTPEPQQLCPAEEGDNEKHRET